MEGCVETVVDCVEMMNEQAHMYTDGMRTDVDGMRTDVGNAKCNLNIEEEGFKMAQTIQSGVNDHLKHFAGNLENAQYFVGLCGFMQGLSKEQSYVCDPRDHTKLERVKDWKPEAAVKAADEFLLSDESSANFISKQTAVEDRDRSDADWSSSNTKDQTTAVSAVENKPKTFHCGVDGCNQTFSPLALYEAHYHRCHNYMCATCRRSFVSNFLLDIHLQENHDSYFQVLSPRIDMYCCLVEACPLKFRTPELRKDHLVSVHKFPSNFCFHRPLKVTGYKSGSASKAKTKSSDTSMDSTASNAGHSVDESNGMELELESLQVTSKTSKSKATRSKTSPRGSSQSHSQRIPSTVCFGRGSQRAFQCRGRGGSRRGRHWHQMEVAESGSSTSVDIEKVDMNDLADALS